MGLKYEKLVAGAYSEENILKENANLLRRGVGFLDNEKMTHFIKDAGVLFAFALAMILVSIFTVAYYSPTKTVTVTINMLGEADFEFCLIWLIVMPTIITGYWLVYQKEITPDAEKNIRPGSQTESSREIAV